MLLMKSGGLGSRMSGRSSSDGPKAAISGDQTDCRSTSIGNASSLQCHFRRVDHVSLVLHGVSRAECPSG